MKLNGYLKLIAVIKLKSGLHIGSGEEISKSEPLPILKLGWDKYPYIPGSSIKGKMRHILEIIFDTHRQNPSDPCGCGTCPICHLFGCHQSKNTKEPGRLLFRDSFLTDVSKEKYEKYGLENKPGVSIDRNTGTAKKGAVFPYERLPEGAELNLEISCRYFDGDNKENIKKWLATGLYLIEQDTLGGYGSRGSGHVEFKEITFDGVAFFEDWRKTAEQEKKNLLTFKIK